MPHRRPHLDFVRLALAAALFLLASMGTMTALWTQGAPDAVAEFEFEPEPESEQDPEQDDDRDDDADARSARVFLESGAKSAPPATNQFARPSTELDRLLRPPIA